MCIGQKLAIATLAAVLGGLIVSVRAESPNRMERMPPDQSMAGSGMVRIPTKAPG